MAEAERMTPENGAAVVPGSGPRIHVWMTIEDAARELGTPAALLNCQLELGELESRPSDEGATEVLVALPPRSKPADGAERVGVSIVPGRVDAEQIARVPSDSIPALAGALLPMLQAMRQAQREELRTARRWARLAWSVAAVLLLAFAGAAVLAGRTVTLTRSEVRLANEKLQHTAGERAELNAQRAALAADRDALRARLGEARQAAARLEGELAVERQVEDTLFRAALARHASASIAASTPAQPNASAVANSAN